MAINKPITAEAHCAIDHALAAGYTAAPFVFGVGGAMRVLGPAIGAGALTLAALTRQRLAVRSTISYRTHGNIDRVFLPAIPILATLGDPHQRRLLATALTITGTVFALSDFDADEASPASS